MFFAGILKIHIFLVMHLIIRARVWNDISRQRWQEQYVGILSEKTVPYFTRGANRRFFPIWGTLAHYYGTTRRNLQGSWIVNSQGPNQIIIIISRSQCMQPLVLVVCWIICLTFDQPFALEHKCSKSGIGRCFSKLSIWCVQKFDHS